MYSVTYISLKSQLLLLLFFSLISLNCIVSTVRKQRRETLLTLRIYYSSTLHSCYQQFDSFETPLTP